MGLLLAGSLINADIGALPSLRIWTAELRKGDIYIVTTFSAVLVAFGGERSTGHLREAESPGVGGQHVILSSLRVAY